MLNKNIDKVIVKSVNWDDDMIVIHTEATYFRGSDHDLMFYIYQVDNNDETVKNNVRKAYHALNHALKLSNDMNIDFSISDWQKEINTKNGELVQKVAVKVGIGQYTISKISIDGAGIVASHDESRIKSLLEHFTSDKYLK